MNYILYMPNLANKLELEIDEKEFHELKKAKEFLHYLVSLEETYDILISNYAEFEQEIFKLTLQNVIYSDFTTVSFYKLRMHLNKRLINILTSVKLYQDLGKHQIPECFNERKKYQNEIKCFLSNQYDNNKHYKFMEELRRYTQHAGLAIHLTRFNMNRINSDKNYPLEYSINFASYSERLKKDKMFNASKFPEMEDEIDLKIAVRHYIECISFVHDLIRKLFENFANNSRNVIKSAHTKFEEKFNHKAEFLRTSCIDGKSIKEDIAILLDWDDVRIKLQQKNGKLTNLSKGYITSITKK